MLTSFAVAKKAEAAARLLGILKESETVRAVIDDDRRKRAERRAQVIAQIDVDERRQRPVVERATKALTSADAKLAELEAKVAAARAERQRAFDECAAAQRAMNLIRPDAELELRETADPNIAIMLNWLSSLDERVRQEGLKLWANRSRSFATGRWETAMFSNLETEVEPIRAELREMLSEVRAMWIGDYGLDPLPRLREIEAAARAAIKPVEGDLGTVAPVEYDDPLEL